MRAGSRWPFGAVWLPFALFIALADPATAGDARTADVREIAEGVYVRPGRVGPLFETANLANIGFVVGSRCVAVIDSGGSAGEGRALDAAIRELTDVPVCYVINTHVHPDHVLGNEAFEGREVQFVGHDRLPAAMAARGDTYRRRFADAGNRDGAASKVVLPERTVGDTLQLDLGERILTLRAHPIAHTDNDLTVLDTRSGTLFAGDLVFLEHLPVLDGSINGWLDELAALMQETYLRVVPGHGPVTLIWPDGGIATVQYLEDLRAATRTWIAAGRDLYDAQEGIEVTRPARWRLIGQYHKGNVAAAFAELEWEE